MKLVGVDILVKPRKEESYSIGDLVAGTITIKTNRTLVFWGLKVYFVWRVRAGVHSFSEDLGVIRLAHRTEVEPGKQLDFDFAFKDPIDRSTFVAQELEATYSIEARITPIVRAMTLRSGDSVGIFSRSYVEGVARINVTPIPSTFRVVPQNLSIKGTDLWWLGSAGGWLAATAIGVLPGIIVGLGALAISSMIYSNQLYYLQQTALRVLEGGDNGMRIMLYTTADARVLNGGIYYQIRDVRANKEEEQQIGRPPLLRVGGPIRKFGRMTTEGFEVILPWITRPLPSPRHIGATHYRWELLLLPEDKVTFSGKKWGIVVRQLKFSDTGWNWSR